MFNPKILASLLLTLSIFLTGCEDLLSGIKTQSGNTQALAELEEELFDVPSSIASAEFQNSVAYLGKVADTYPESNGIYDAYKPIPAYVHFANEAKNNVKAFIHELQKYDIPDNIVIEEGETKIVASSMDTTILGAPQEFFRIRIFKSEKLALHLNYWKNARGQYRGNFYYYETEKPGEIGNAVFIHYNGHNNGIQGKRMVVTFYQTLENMKEPNDPQIIRMYLAKKGGKVYTTGASYHPTFSDEDNFWEPRKYIYLFRAAANIETDKAVLKAAFLPVDSLRTGAIDDFSIDKMILMQLYKNMQTDPATGELKSENELRGMRQVIRWSLETGRAFDETDTTLISEIFEEFEPQIGLDVEITVEEFRQYLLNHKDLFIQRNIPEELDLLRFISLRQPIFLSKDGDIRGSSYDRDVNGQDFGIEPAELEELTDELFDPMDAIDFDPSEEEETELN